MEGEIYHLSELVKGDRRGNVAERVLDLYSVRGLAGLGVLDAAAAVIVRDARKSLLIAMRDRFGNVPAYHACRRDSVYWSSALASLRLWTGHPQLNWHAFDFFVRSEFVPAPWTFYQEIQMLPAAHTLWCRADS